MKQQYKFIQIPSLSFSISNSNFSRGFVFIGVILVFLTSQRGYGSVLNMETNKEEYLFASSFSFLNLPDKKVVKESPTSVACTITGITHTLTACDPDNNIYSVSGHVTFIDKPSSGLFVVEIDGSIFDVSASFAISPRFFVINNLVADGGIKTITAYFTADPSCTFSVNYTAPVSCNNEVQTTLCSGSDLDLSCEGGSCPSPYPDVASNTAYTGVDNNYAVFIGGDLSITGGRELEGRGFVYGDFNFNASGSNYNTGAVGVGTGVAPADNTYWLTIGGDLNFNGTYLLAALGTTAEGLVAVKGTASDNDFANGANGQLVRSPNLDLSVFDACFTTVNTHSQCWATQSSSANGTYSNSFGTFTFSSTDGASGLYVFNITADMNPGYGGTANFQNFPNDATILINVNKPGSSDNITLNIGAFSNVSDELRQRIIWNFPDASVVTLRGWSQFLGAIVVPSRTSLLDMVEVPGFNGRIIAGGDVTQVSSGSEFHNYSFEGDLSALSCSASPPCSLSSIGESLETCNANSTTSDPSDDYITFSLNPTGSNLGATYSVTANNSGIVTLAGGGAATGISYGSATAFRLQNGSADGSTTFTITVTDVAGGTCQATTTVMQNSCSASCNISSAGKTLETCNNNSTTSDPSDDYITFSLNPTGLNLGATYSVTANNGGTVTLAAGGAATGINYGSATAFRLQNGSADGATTFTITVTDVVGGGCTVTTTMIQASCSLCMGVTPYTICADGTNSITLTADGGYTNYQWFNEAGALSGETNQTLMITGLTNGLGDGMEEFYYTALDGAGCPITLCCPVIVIAESCLLDWGDLPDISASTNANDYQTSIANNGPRHRIITGLHLGTTVDSEADGQPSADALGDGVDEDGLTLFANLGLYPNMNFRLPFTYVNTTGNTAYVEAWIDWNGDGDFDEPNEMVADWEDSTMTFPDRLEVSIPLTAQTGILLGYRIRISHQDNMTPYGLQPNGEVEDYLIEIDCPQVCLPVQINIIKK